MPRETPGWATWSAVLAVGCSDTSAGPERSEGLVLNATKEVDADTNPLGYVFGCSGCWLLAVGCSDTSAGPERSEGLVLNSTA
jgi:hypothetical protein